MNKFQQAVADVVRQATPAIKDGVENAVDNIRSEYEQAMWGRQTTGGECEIFTDTPAQEPEPEPEQDNDIDM
jgi:hypothetical protein